MNQQTSTHAFPKLRGFTPAANLFQTCLIQKTAAKKTDPFASALAHEVRNPLSNINLAVEMLRSGNKDPEQEIFLAIILRNSARINGLVTDLLVSSRADEMPKDEHSIPQLIDEVLAQTEDRILLKKIRVQKNYATGDSKIMVNKQQVKMALTNIIINAIDAMPSQNGNLNIVTRLTNDECLVEIEDNGVGISKENIAHIFKPYFTGKANGMGLGLSTSLSLLHSNHASVDVKSEEGSGTRFTVSFGSIVSANLSSPANPSNYRSYGIDRLLSRSCLK